MMNVAQRWLIITTTDKNYVIMKTRKLKFWILILIRTDILQGQALFIRVKQKILFHFRTRDRQKRQTDRKDRQAEMTDRQKR